MQYTGQEFARGRLDRVSTDSFDFEHKFCRFKPGEVWKDQLDANLSKVVVVDDYFVDILVFELRELLDFLVTG